jgi:hypothetical protein
MGPRDCGLRKLQQFLPAAELVFQVLFYFLDDLHKIVNATRSLAKFFDSLPVVRGVTPLGKDQPLPARRAWRPTASRLAEPNSSGLTEH